MAMIEPVIYEMEATERPSEAVVTAVAAVTGVDPATLDPPLSELVDPDAIDSLFEPTPSGAHRSGGLVEFSYGDCDVTVQGDRRVFVYYWGTNE